MRRAAFFLCVAFASAALAQAPPQQEDKVAEEVRLAKRDIDSGEYAKASQRLSQLVEAGHFRSPDLRAEAYRLLGMSLLLQTPPRPEEAKSAFRDLLFIDPDTELDPFYVPQKVVDFFDQEKKELEPALAPIRAQKRAEREARRKELEAEATRRREEEQQRRLRALQPNVERRVIQREFWVSLLPFGLGQIQNGDRSLGYTLATMEIVFGAASAGSALLIEGLRDNTTQKFGPTEYRIATTLEIVKWVGAGLFYGLWAGAPYTRRSITSRKRCCRTSSSSPGPPARPSHLCLRAPRSPSWSRRSPGRGPPRCDRKTDAEMATLTVHLPDAAPAHFRILKPLVSIGAAPDSDIRIPHMRGIVAVQFDGRSFTATSLEGAPLVVNGRKRDRHALDD
ncbi:MAG: hypothetical protein ACJ79C_01140, partial [Myxococcales bacterium]